MLSEPEPEGCAVCQVATLTALTDLNVAGCGKVSDAALEEFGARLPRLEHFACSYCNRVTDRRARPGPSRAVAREMKTLSKHFGARFRV